MKTGVLIVGTVRSRQGTRHTVVLPDGTRHSIIFEGTEIPRIGGDFIGMVDASSGQLRMRLVKDVTALILQGRTLISVSGRPEITARMLSRMLRGAAPGIVRPGVGGIIERTPHVNDPYLAWAIGVLEPAAAKLGIALNVIDPLALADAPWSSESLKEDVLPADATGDAGGLTDLQSLLRGGFNPHCRRTLEMTGKAVVSSVDFIIPYSPFATGMSFSGELGGAFRSEAPKAPLSGPDARRISAFRQISMAFAQRYLGRVKAEPDMVRHVEESFADAAAAIAYLTSGGDERTVRNFARLRNAALARWDGTGEAPPATGAVVEAVLSGWRFMAVKDVGALLTQAAEAARAAAPSTSAALAALRDSCTDKGVFVELDGATAGTLRTVKRAYERDLDETLGRLRGRARAVERFARFGVKTAPAGLEDVFDEATSSAGGDAVLGLEVAIEDQAELGGDGFLDAPEFRL